MSSFIIMSSEYSRNAKA